MRASPGTRTTTTANGRKASASRRDDEGRRAGRRPAPTSGRRRSDRTSKMTRMRSRPASTSRAAASRRALSARRTASEARAPRGHRVRRAVNSPQCSSFPVSGRGRTAAVGIEVVAERPGRRREPARPSRIHGPGRFERAHHPFLAYWCLWARPDRGSVAVCAGVASGPPIISRPAASSVARRRPLPRYPVSFSPACGGL